MRVIAVVRHRVSKRGPSAEAKPKHRRISRKKGTCQRRHVVEVPAVNVFQDDAEVHSAAANNQQDSPGIFPVSLFSNPAFRLGAAQGFVTTIASFPPNC